MTELLNVEFVDETGDDPPADPRRDPGVPQRRRRRGQRDDDPADRLGRKGSRRTPRSAPRAGREPRAHPAGDRGAAALRTARTAHGPVRDPRRQPVRPDRAGRRRDDDADRGRVPRRAPIRPRRRRIQHPSRRPAAPHLQRRRALLPGLGAGAARRPSRPGRDPQTIPGMGGRPGQRQAQPDVDGAGLGDDAGVVAR